MTTNQTHNPYVPPKAAVSDVSGRDDAGTQLPPLWSARGRIGRLRYLCYVGVGYLLVACGAGLVSGIAAAGGLGLGILNGFVTFGALIAFGVFSVLAGIKRAHDMDWSGWAVLAAMLIPFVAFIWIFKAGTPGANRFGPPPAPNTAGIKIGGLIFPVLFGIGILAAIAIPAYSDYQKRVRAQEAAIQSQSQEAPVPAGQGGTQ